MKKGGFRSPPSRSGHHCHGKPVPLGGLHLGHLDCPFPNTAMTGPPSRIPSRLPVERGSRASPCPSAFAAASRAHHSLKKASVREFSPTRTLMAFLSPSLSQARAAAFQSKNSLVFSMSTPTSAEPERATAQKSPDRERLKKTGGNPGGKTTESLPPGAFSSWRSPGLVSRCLPRTSRKRRRLAQKRLESSSHRNLPARSRSASESPANPQVSRTEETETVQTLTGTFRESSCQFCGCKRFFILYLPFSAPGRHGARILAIRSVKPLKATPSSPVTKRAA
jgi:hypothetical protein